jgi:hypothetical protein
VSKSREEKNKSIVLEAFETLFNKRDYKNALNCWSPKYIWLRRARTSTGRVPRTAAKSGYTNVQYLGRVRCGGIALSGDLAQANTRVMNSAEGGTQDVVSR